MIDKTSPPPFTAIEIARLHASGAVTDLTPASVTLVCAELVELDAHKCQENHLHPDWSKLEASRESLREHMQLVRAHEAKLADVVNRAHVEALQCRKPQGAWCHICNAPLVVRRIVTGEDMCLGCGRSMRNPQPGELFTDGLKVT